MTKAEAVLFDFDGVLCTDKFYTNLAGDYPDVHDFITTQLFGGDFTTVIDWMKGVYTYNEINLLISEATGIPFTTLTEYFIESVRAMKLNEPLLRFASSLRRNEVKTAIVTGNMDIFNIVTVPENKLYNYFQEIVNSCDYGLLKNEENGKLFDITLEKLGLASFENTWLIDDSPVNCALYESKGGKSYRYTGQPDFEAWLEDSGVFIPKY